MSITRIRTSSRIPPKYPVTPPISAPTVSANAVIATATIRSSRAAHR